MKFFLSVLLIIFFFTFPISSYADSGYVLPYPSAMPGGISYKIHQIYEVISKVWYFGDFGQFDYNLKESDKYLVEAKTLFEYNQYLFGYKSLIKSDEFFKKIYPSLTSAQKNNKDTKEKSKKLSRAATKHIEALKKLLTDSPSTFTWSPEKQKSSILDLSGKIKESISIREKYL